MQIFHDCVCEQLQILSKPEHGTAAASGIPQSIKAWSSIFQDCQKGQGKACPAVWVFPALVWDAWAAPRGVQELPEPTLLVSVATRGCCRTADAAGIGEVGNSSRILGLSHTVLTRFYSFSMDLKPRLTLTSYICQFHDTIMLFLLCQYNCGEQKALVQASLSLELCVREVLTVKINFSTVTST